LEVLFFGFVVLNQNLLIFIVFNKKGGTKVLFICDLTFLKKGDFSEICLKNNYCARTVSIIST
jgi:hypothetical protein